MTVTTQLTRFEDKVEDRMTLVLKKVALDLFRGVVMKTPVDTERARGNWMAGVNHIVQAETMSVSKQSPFQQIISDISNARIGDKVSLANSVPYIGILEYGGYPKNPDSKSQTAVNAESGAVVVRSKSVDGYSRQAPQGMVRITIKNYLPTLKKAVNIVLKEIP